MVIFTTPYESTATRRRLDKKAQEKTKEQRAYSEAASMGRQDSDDGIPTDLEMATHRSVVPVLTPRTMPHKPVLCRQDTLDRSKCLHLCLRLVCYKAYTGLPLYTPYEGEATVGCEDTRTGNPRFRKISDTISRATTVSMPQCKTLYSPGWIFPSCARYRYGCVNNPALSTCWYCQMALSNKLLRE
jgi:hypothetical protein